MKLKLFLLGSLIAGSLNQASASERDREAIKKKCDDLGVYETIYNTIYTEVASPDFKAPVELRQSALQLNELYSLCDKVRGSSDEEFYRLQRTIAYKYGQIDSGAKNKVRELWFAETKKRNAETKKRNAKLNA